MARLNGGIRCFPTIEIDIRLDTLESSKPLQVAAHHRDLETENLTACAASLHGLCLWERKAPVQATKAAGNQPRRSRSSSSFLRQQIWIVLAE